jgi:hypothetical protein
MSIYCALVWLICAPLLWLGGVIWGRNGERRRWLMSYSAQGGKIPERRWP